ncbi:TrbG/VirB9 family P-type conjugative transfer protein [Burkholderia pseudomallei]|uniref:TrbG/VirB9 family P-type conjugative transfer protein n=1 Tax=Burkholderia pseudomallei TaxID=28450 RepID=UPI0012F4E40F
MKHSASTVLSASLLVAGCMLESACAEPPAATVPVYDFDWRLDGAADVRPYQVFDDGQKIYLQFADPKRVPAIFADTPGGLVLLRWRPDPPYVIVDQMERALVFRAGASKARAVRESPGEPPILARLYRAVRDMPAPERSESGSSISWRTGGTFRTSQRPAGCCPPTYVLTHCQDRKVLRQCRA